MAAKKDYSYITDEMYQAASDWLQAGGTKKGACDILKLTNNKTMERLIQEHYEGKANAKRLRAEKRSQAVTPSELVEIIMDYLNGYSLVELSDRYFRSADLIKHHLVKNGAFLRVQGKIDHMNPPRLPDECIAETFEPGQYVWSAKYGCIAQIKAPFKNAYRIQVMGNGRQEQAYQAPWELGSLAHLEALGVKLSALEDYMPALEVNHLLSKTMREANKRVASDARRKG